MRIAATPFLALLARVAFLAAGLLLPSGTAAAEPPVWTFDVAEIEEVSPLEHTIRLIPAPSGVHYPRTCREFVVHVVYQAGVGVDAYTVEIFTEDGYAKAIRMLRDAQAQHKLVRLGSLDRGFGEIDGKPECEVASAGLGVLIGDDGVPGVYSVF